MTESGNKKLNLDAVLGQWPERSGETEYEARAERIMSRVLATADAKEASESAEGAAVGIKPEVATTALSDDDLFAAPLAVSNEDGELPSPLELQSERDRAKERDRDNLREMTKELTKMAKELSPSRSASAPQREASTSGRKDDSGIIDLAAAAAADPGGKDRAQTTALASEDLFESVAKQKDDEGQKPAAASGPAARRAVEVREGRPSRHDDANSRKSEREREDEEDAARGETTEKRRVVALAAPAHRSNAAQVERQKIRERVLGGFAALAAAAALFLLMRQSAAPVASTAGAPVAAASASSPALLAQNAPTEPASARPPEPVVDPNALPAAPTTTTPPEPVAVVAKPAGGAKPKVHPDRPGDPPAKGDSPPPNTGGTLATGPTDLSSAMRKEIGDDREKTPAASLTGSGSMGNVPQKPGQGAVTGALGAVLPQARACLQPDDPVSRAAIVFTSNGAVQSVSVTGAAAGTPTEACIKAALSKAKVQAFAEPTYTANITIRH